jgi:hypothetical protein
MAIIKVGSFSVVAGGTAQNLVLGFIPSYFQMTNLTNVSTPVNDELVKAEWYAGMANASGIGTNYTGAQPAIEINPIAANGFTPYTTGDSLLYVPAQVPYNDTTRTPMGASTLLKITAITQAANAEITSALHSLTTADEGVTKVTFHYCTGMTQINTLTATVVSIVDVNKFTVNINSSNFSTFTNDGKGQCNVITGAPANTLYSNVSLPTAQANLGQIGLTLGTTLMVTTADVWRYTAVLDSPVTS